jgi:signal transduction histidine kinase
LEWPGHPAGLHSVQFYTDDGFLLEGVTRYVGSALGAGDAAVVIATPAHRDGLAQRLRTLGFDLELATTQGRYVPLDADETLDQFMVDGAPDPARFTVSVGGTIARAATRDRRVAAFGEMVALLWERGNREAALRLEQLWNDLAHELTFDLHCAYPMSCFSQYEDAGQIADVCAEHNRVVPTESYMSLLTEDERLRTIALFQQKAEALETEVREKNRLLIAEQEARALAQEAIAQREEFLSVAAHELKTPITSLRMATQVMLRQIARDQVLEPTRLARMLGVIEVQSEQLTHLTNQLLDIARLDGDKLILERRELDLVPVLLSVMERIQVQSTQHPMTLTGLPSACISADSLRVEQVLVNLLDNAVKYSPQGGAIELNISWADPDMVQVAVRDHGVGITAEQCEKVFERFYRVAADVHTTGLGLGLYISRRIVESHGGRLWAECPPDGGARFVMRLPVTTA